MSIANVTEISATSEKSFDDAIIQGITRASKKFENVKSAWIQDMRVEVSEGKPKLFQVNMRVTCVLRE